MLRSVMGRGDEGGISLVLLALAASVIAIGLITSSAWLMRQAGSALRLFDDERYSALYCSGPLLDPMRTPVVVFARSFDCIQPRSDYAAPGFELSRPPPTLCLLLQRLPRLSSALAAAGELGERPCR